MKITADENKIEILVDGQITATINNEDKSEVNGELIYNSLKYTPDDKYELEPFDVSEEGTKKNYMAAKLIYDFYKKIVEGINAIEIKVISSDEINTDTKAI